MKDAEIYRKAAELIAETSYCKLACTAIQTIIYHGSLEPYHSTTKRFREVFDPGFKSLVWLPYGDKESRILALLLMAEIAEEEDK